MSRTDGLPTQPQDYVPCWYKRCSITVEEEPVLSQELAIWCLREPAFISKSLSNPGSSKRTDQKWMPIIALAKSKFHIA